MLRFTQHDSEGLSMTTSALVVKVLIGHVSVSAMSSRNKATEGRERPMATRKVAAVDLGAESGRVMLANFDGRQLSLEEVHRFPNQPVTLHGHRFWNILSLWDETIVGLRK